MAQDNSNSTMEMGTSDQVTYPILKLSMDRPSQ